MAQKITIEVRKKYERKKKCCGSFYLRLLIKNYPPRLIEKGQPSILCSRSSNTIPKLNIKKKP